MNFLNSIVTVAETVLRTSNFVLFFLLTSYFSHFTHSARLRGIQITDI